MLALDVHGLIGVNPSSDKLAQYIASLCTLASLDDVQPQVKSYKDAVYLNYFQLGLSLLFTPKNGYKPGTGLTRAALRDADLALESLDFYNVPKPDSNTTKGTSARKAELAFATYPSIPFALAVAEGAVTRPAQLTVAAGTTGQEFVACLGEPARKGGGAGPSSGSIGIWCEWTKDGLMVEFGGVEATGAQAWERGKDAVWHVITVFAAQPSA